MKPLAEFKVGDWMTPKTTTILASAKLVDAIRLMDSEKLSMLPVLDEHQNLIGVISKTDMVKKTRELQTDLSALHSVDLETQEFLIQLLAEEGNTNVVKDLMTSPAQTITAETSMADAARKMLELGYHHLPVVGEADRPVGILSTTDFVKAFAAPL